MKFSFKVLLASLVAFLFIGCGIKTQEYHSSADNVMELRRYTTKVAVGDFTANNKGESHILCRLAETISTPSGEPFPEYIRKAFVEELKVAGLYEKNADIIITGNLNKIYGSSMIGNAYWEFDITLTEKTQIELLISNLKQSILQLIQLSQPALIWLQL